MTNSPSASILLELRELAYQSRGREPTDPLRGQGVTRLAPGALTRARLSYEVTPAVSCKSEYL